MSILSWIIVAAFAATLIVLAITEIILTVLDVEGRARRDGIIDPDSDAGWGEW